MIRNVLKLYKLQEKVDTIIDHIHDEYFFTFQIPHIILLTVKINWDQVTYWIIVMFPRKHFRN